MNEQLEQRLRNFDIKKMGKRFPQFQIFEEEGTDSIAPKGNV